VGYYSAAEKLVRAIMGLLIPVSQTVYPYLSKVASESKERAIYFISRILGITGGVMIVVSVLLFMFPRALVMLIFGSQYENSVVVLKIMAFLPFVLTVSNVLGQQTMLTFDRKRPLFWISASAALVSVCLSLILAPWYGCIGVAVSWLLTEMFVVFTMFAYLVRNKLNVVYPLRNVFFQKQRQEAALIILLLVMSSFSWR
jgi:PST family polysaccharide transporter